MTENERVLRDIIIDGNGFDYDESIPQSIFEEIQQYRAIGTVEEIQKKMEELERWHTDIINENIKNAFAHTSTLICHNCDHKDEYIEELESEVSEYKAIGTIEEFKALKEKAEPKEPIKIKTDEKILYMCPSCRKIFVEAYDTVQRGYIPKFCEMCGQDIKWSWGQ